ncbi:C-type lectin domain family 14 member A [Dicentrarchus labrax]|uniref:C-type lectin domain family 14 member A n=1 Tax=Dicentrarchus labrax TaxID=13489 RepID=UPI0021F57684|nr:C-type lectin domain family 14 member A [Dicentrarchus labrax]XP_051250569.1 C-type lectin domain family 14 member A [Dicentrarchus labrax]
MESWFCSCWVYLMVIVAVRDISADPASPPRYTIHHTKVTFNSATENCFPGVLTTLATKQDVNDILGFISRSVSSLNKSNFTFWVGLRKDKNKCVTPMLPLKGFQWTEDGSKEMQVSHWTLEPELTCTSVLCGALQMELERSMVTGWGLIPVGCSKGHKFICKLRDGLTGGTPKPAEPKPATAEPHKPEPRPATQKPEPTIAEPERPTQEPEPDLNPKIGPKLQGPEPDSGSEPAVELDSCQRPNITRVRSFRLDPDNSRRIQVECWSNVQVELRCSGRPAVWRLLDDSPVNITTICQPCEVGFKRDTSGNCVDIDECRGDNHCRHTCLNTEGSYRCVCSDEDGKQHEEDSTECTDSEINSDNGLMSGILIPVLVAVAALVVLVVVIAVTVKCCLKRRSKKRAIKKAEKMAMKKKYEKVEI